MLQFMLPIAQARLHAGITLAYHASFNQIHCKPGYLCNDPSNLMNSLTLHYIANKESLRSFAAGMLASLRVEMTAAVSAVKMLWKLIAAQQRLRISFIAFCKRPVISSLLLNSGVLCPTCLMASKSSSSGPSSSCSMPCSCLNPFACC